MPPPAPTSTENAAGPRLDRELGLLDATMIVMGSMIGSGIFITSAQSAQLVGAPGWLLVAWALAGLLTICGALCCAELAAMLPRAGGQYVFFREAYGRPLGFLFGWATFLVVQTGTIAAVAVAFAKFLGVLVPAISADNFPLFQPIRFAYGRYALSLSTQQLVGLALIVALTFTNTRGLKIGKHIQNSFTVAKTAALFGLIVAGLALRANHGSGLDGVVVAAVRERLDPVRAGLKVNAVGGWALALLLGQALIGPLFSQTAWNNVTFTGGETRNPGWTLPRALLLGCGSVVGLYLLANVAYIVTLTLPAIQNAPQGRVGTLLMETVLGKTGTVVMALAILVSTFGCVNGLVLAGARVYYAMARDGLFFRSIGTTNRHHVPAVALWTQGLWAALLVLPVTVATDPVTLKPAYGNLYNQLLEYIIPVDVTFYTLMVGAVLVLRRKRPDLDRPYRTWGHPLPALIYISLAVLLVIDFVALAPETSGIGFLILLAGIPVYLVWSRSAVPPPPAKTSEAPSP